MLRIRMNMRLTLCGTSFARTGDDNPPRRAGVRPKDPHGQSPASNAKHQFLFEKQSQEFPKLIGVYFSRSRWKCRGDLQVSIK